PPGPRRPTCSCSTPAARRPAGYSTSPTTPGGPPPSCCCSARCGWPGSRCPAWPPPASGDVGPFPPPALPRPGRAPRGWGRLVLVPSTAVRQPQGDLAISVVLRAPVTAAAKLLSHEYAAA